MMIPHWAQINILKMLVAFYICLKWGKTILEVEQNTSVEYRLAKKKSYSSKMENNEQDGLCVRWKQNVSLKLILCRTVI